MYGYSNSINGKKGKPFKHNLEKTYRDSQIVDSLMPHFLGHSYEDVNNWICGKKGLREDKEHTALWRIMLDSKTIKDNSLAFDKNLTLGEDTKFINQYFLYENSIGFLDKCLYYLTIRDNSANNTSNKDALLMMNNKLKLINARKELDALALNRGKDIHQLWQGTVVFSVMQLLLRFATDVNDNCSYGTLRVFLNNDDVKKAVANFYPRTSLKAIPFYLLKLKLNYILYIIFGMLPKRIIKKFI